MNGEFVSMKQRYVTSRAVCYRIGLAVAKLVCLGKPVKYFSLTFKQFYPRFFRLKHNNSSKCASPYFYIAGFVAVYLSKSQWLGLPRGRRVRDVAFPVSLMSSLNQKSSAFKIWMFFLSFFFFFFQRITVSNDFVRNGDMHQRFAKGAG